MEGVELMSIREGGRGQGISLYAKFKTSRMLPQKKPLVKTFLIIFFDLK